MPDNHPSSSTLTESLVRRHEAGDPHLRNVVMVVISVVVMLILSLAGTGLFIHTLSRSRPRQPMQTLGIVHAPNLKPLARFPGPPLEIDDGHADWLALRQQQLASLNIYAWVDRSNGIVRIPIQRAMALLLQGGLPVRTNAVASTGISSLQLLQERPEQR